MRADTSNASLRLTCPAKVNLALSVGALNADGLHPIASWMVAVTFGDEMQLQRREDGGDASFDIAFADDAPRPGVVDWPIEQDLAYRAHGLMQEQCGQALPIHCTLGKRIPAGAGLGGGSSDAGAMLVGLKRLFQLDVADEELIELSRSLGSDVAFATGAALGQTSAIVSGVGEVLEPAPLQAVIPLVLIFPPLSCPTGAVYRAFDALSAGSNPQVDLGRVRALLANQPPAQDAPFNDLAAPACAVEPRLAEARERVGAQLKLPVHITGSGATLFVIAPTAQTAEVLARKTAALTGLPAVATRTR